MKKNTVYEVNESKAISETLDGETIIINIETGSYYSINKTGSIIWEMIKSKNTLDDIFNNLLQRYIVDENLLETTTENFFSFLKSENLISEVPQGVQHDPSAISQDKVEFIVPEIKKYEDMQQMLLADPIHDVDEMGWPMLKPKEN